MASGIYSQHKHHQPKNQIHIDYNAAVQHRGGVYHKNPTHATSGVTRGPQRMSTAAQTMATIQAQTGRKARPSPFNSPLLQENTHDTSQTGFVSSSLDPFQQDAPRYGHTRHITSDSFSTVNSVHTTTMSNPEWSNLIDQHIHSEHNLNANNSSVPTKDVEASGTRRRSIVISEPVGAIDFRQPLVSTEYTPQEQDNSFSTVYQHTTKEASQWKKEKDKQVMQTITSRLRNTVSDAHSSPQERQVRFVTRNTEHDQLHERTQSADMESKSRDTLKPSHSHSKSTSALLSANEPTRESNHPAWKAAKAKSKNNVVTSHTTSDHTQDYSEETGPSVVPAVASPPLELLNAPEFEFKSDGFLFKKGGGKGHRQNWLKRFFMIVPESGELFYFSKGDLTGSPRGCIQLKNAEIQCPSIQGLPTVQSELSKKPTQIIKRMLNKIPRPHKRLPSFNIMSHLPSFRNPLRRNRNRNRRNQQSAGQGLTQRLKAFKDRNVKTSKSMPGPEMEFQLATTSGRTYRLRANNNEELRDWFYSIMLIIYNIKVEEINKIPRPRLPSFTTQADTMSAASGEETEYIGSVYSESEEEPDSADDEIFVAKDEEETMPTTRAVLPQTQSFSYASSTHDPQAMPRVMSLHSQPSSYSQHSLHSQPSNYSPYSTPLHTQSFSSGLSHGNASSPQRMYSTHSQQTTQPQSNISVSSYGRPIALDPQNPPIMWKVEGSGLETARAGEWNNFVVTLTRKAEIARNPSLWELSDPILWRLEGWVSRADSDSWITAITFKHVAQEEGCVQLVGWYKVDHLIDIRVRMALWPPEQLMCSENETFKIHCPTVISVVPGPTHVRNCIISGPGVESAHEGENTMFTITSCDGVGNPRNVSGDAFQFAVTGPAKMVNVRDNGNGSYDAIYRVDSIGTEPVTVSVMLDGQMLPGCPLRPRIIPKHTSYSNLSHATPKSNKTYIRNNLQNDVPTVYSSLHPATQSSTFAPMGLNFYEDVDGVRSKERTAHTRDRENSSQRRASIRRVSIQINETFNQLRQKQ